MKKKFKLGVIGAGFMSNAIVGGVISSGVLSPEQIIVSDISETAVEKIHKKGVTVTMDNLYLSDNAEFVMFAVKPQTISSVLKEIKNTTCKKFISIMAGIKKDKIKNELNDISVARCMPNTPCSIGYGAIAIDLTDYKDLSDKEFIKNIFKSLAVLVEVPESKLNAVTGISGSSPAYFYLFLKCIIDSGVKNGLTENEAKTLAVNTMIGSGKMVLNNSDKSLDELINAVCSKGGTTIEAVKIFNEMELAGITDKAIDACIKRSFELENL